MSIKRLTCFFVQCDTPECDFDPYMDGMIHFASVDKAVACLTRQGWRVGETVLCPGCVAGETCAASGHEWIDWQDFPRGPVLYRWRCCNRCGQQEFDPPQAEILLLIETDRILSGIDAQLDDPGEPS